MCTGLGTWGQWLGHESPAFTDEMWALDEGSGPPAVWSGRMCLSLSLTESSPLSGLQEVCSFPPLGPPATTLHLHTNRRALEPADPELKPLVNNGLWGSTVHRNAIRDSRAVWIFSVTHR